MFIYAAARSFTARSTEADVVVGENISRGYRVLSVGG